MLEAEYTLVAAAAENKVIFFNKEKIPFFISSMMAGFFVGICVILIQAMAGMLGDFSGIRILQGISFAAALSLIIFAGSDLFTGNIFILTTGVCRNAIKMKDLLFLSVFCYLGNFAGSLLIASLFMGTGLLQGATLEAIQNAVLLKIQPGFWELFIRGILCNVMVCAAVWCAFKMKSETGKLIMIFWCIYIFIVCGFEHSIANMTLFSMQAISGCNAQVLIKMLINLGAATAGNITGGIALSLAYWVIAKKV